MFSLSRLTLSSRAGGVFSLRSSLLCSVGPTGTGSNYKTWQDDPRFQQHKYLPKGGIRRDFSVGPHRRHKFWVYPSEAPQEWAVSILILIITFYAISRITPGESFYSRRRRLIRERIRQEYGLPKGWDDDIEGEEALLTPKADPLGSTDAFAPIGGLSSHLNSASMGSNPYQGISGVEYSQ